MALQRAGEPLVVDCRYQLTDPEAGFKAYQQGHIPGAHYLSLGADLSAAGVATEGRHPLPSAGRFAETLSRIGFTPNRPVIAYDAAGGQFAARFWWLCRWLGFDQVALLDGGWQAWVGANGPVVVDLPVTSRGSPDLALPLSTEDHLLVTAAQLKQGLFQSDCRLIDARAAVRYRGEQELIDPVAGHIPEAVNHPTANNLDDQFKFLSADILAEKFNQLLGPYSPDQVIHSCGSGVNACHNLFAMELAGLSGSRLYPPSWSGWIADPDNFYLQGEAGQESELLRVGS